MTRLDVMPGIDLIAQAEERQAAVSDEDYIKDGLLYCSKCGTKKQTRVTIAGKEKIMFCLCKCGVEKSKAEEAAEKEKKRVQRIRELRTHGILDTEIRKFSFETAEMTDNLNKCKKYVENFVEMLKNNNGLLFWGRPGAGKTFAAGCIANALIDKSVPVLVTSFPRILNGGYDKTDVLKSMREYGLVIIDDLGVERESSYAKETVYMVIDERYKANKPMIITTNLSYSDIQHPKNIELSRIYDRILGVCVPVCFSGESRRVKQGKGKMQAARKIFG